LTSSIFSFADALLRGDERAHGRPEVHEVIDDPRDVGGAGGYGQGAPLVPVMAAAGDGPPGETQEKPAVLGRPCPDAVDHETSVEVMREPRGVKRRCTRRA